MTSRRLTALAVAAISVAILVPAAPAGAGPAAQKSVENEALLTILTSGKLKVRSSMTISSVCSADCSITSSATFVVRGPNATAPPVSSTFLAGTTIDLFLRPNKSLRSSMKDNIKKSKLRVEQTATSLVNGDTDTDSVTFKLKK